MDVEERARRAVALVPKAGSARRVETLYALGLVVFVGGSLHVIAFAPPDLEGHHVALILALLPLGVSLLAFTTGLLSQLRAHRLAIDWSMKGHLERSSAGFFALLERRWAFASWRNSYATSLATNALMAGHADRSIVLLRAITASRTLPKVLEPVVRDRMALTLFALGQTSAARAMLAEETPSSSSWLARRVERAHVALVVEALVGPLELALAAAEKAEAAYERPLSASRRSYAHVQRAYGFLLVAYVFERVARTKPAEARLDVEHRRDRAIARAIGVPPHFYRYLAPVAPDFVAFADRFARS